MGKLILVRHGKSVWNVANIFTGWTDVDLALEGIEEANAAGEIIKRHQITIDICYSSYLKRAIRTGLIILEHADRMHVDFIKSWKLNERNYGAWQGRNKDEVKREVGEELFLKVRRGFDTPPPSLQLTDKRHPKFDHLYDTVNSSYLPASESLEQTEVRVVEYFFEVIIPELVKGKTVLVAAHGNSIRGLMAHIENINSSEIPKVTVPTGVLQVYEFDTNMILKKKYKLEEKNKIKL
ncbi:2,3-diphosphoglycerate-dependent phosphoglycerate mutase [Flavobacterium sp. PL002]|uniref:2,3-bisphosphoglycerate-dependent phosphoglycerate mutase n=1 Tax=Flavobacterium sp. PL002 TaxID=1897058 RepID=UPI001787F18F|nr:2,3-bisphosphoglycerate-dependent phosphoglycerate mutase [Flavobacterium sp. PL002]MBE0391912.1 2,3-bisphosphoglycerate-dependent phosphoglycerate mutase [Flavobacterium sp. PL002]